MNIQSLLKKETIVESARFALIFIIIQRALQTARGIIFARILGPSEYGVYTLAFFFIPLIAAASVLGIPSSFPRYVPQYEKQGMMRDFIHKTYFLAAGATTIVLILCLLFSKQVSGLIYDSSEFNRIIILCSVSLLPITLNENIRVTFNGLRVFKLSYLFTFCRFLVFTLLGIWMVLIYRNAESVIVANLVSLIVVTVLFGYIILKYVAGLEIQRSRIEESGFYRRILRYSIWFAISPIVFNLFRYINHWMLNRFLGLHEVGIYSVAANVSGLIFVFGVVAGNVLMPNLSKLWEEGKKEEAVAILDLVVRGNTVLMLSGAVFIVLFKTQIINLLYGVEYLDSASFMGVLSIFWLFNIVYWTITSYAGLIEKTYIPLVGSTSGLICNVILNIFLIPKYGINGAAVATTISFGIAVIIMFVWFKMEGWRIKINTVITCLLPLILVLEELLMVIVYIVFVGLLFGVEFFMTKDEKSRLYKQVERSIRRKKAG